MKMSELSTADPSHSQASSAEFNTFSISDVAAFTDGRAGAWVFGMGELAYVTFDFDDVSGRWLIDAWDDRPREADGAATPVP